MNYWTKILKQAIVQQLGHRQQVSNFLQIYVHLNDVSQHTSWLAPSIRLSNGCLYLCRVDCTTLFSFVKVLQFPRVSKLSCIILRTFQVIYKVSLYTANILSLFLSLHSRIESWNDLKINFMSQSNSILALIWSINHTAQVCIC